MIKTIALLLISAVASNANPTLDKLFDKRIEANKKLTEFNIQDLDGLKYQKEIFAAEKASGKLWDEFLKYVKNSKDDKLKLLVLKMEFNYELIDSLYLAEEEPLNKVVPMIMKAKDDIKLVEAEQAKLEAKGKK